MNVLITSAGRRTGLVGAFQRATSKLGGRVIAADASPLAPTLYTADEAAVLPPLNAPHYLEVLEALCVARNVTLVVPTIDTELLMLSEARAHFAHLGIVVAVCDSCVVDITGDKWNSVTEFGSRGVRVPASYLPLEARQLKHFPLFIKPRSGSASQHTYKLETHQDLLTLLKRVPNPIVQEFLSFEEITIDALLDLEGQPLHYVPRRRLRTLGGESIQGVTIDDAEIGEFIVRVLGILRDLGARGPLTLQAFLSPEGPILSEINPRFGGGAPLAFAARGDYPLWLIQCARGEPVEPRLGVYERGLYMTRSYAEVFTRSLVS
jgi:carbamoyl-phosphate synthase large subunit